MESNEINKKEESKELQNEVEDYFRFNPNMTIRFYPYLSFYHADLFPWMSKKKNRIK